MKRFTKDERNGAIVLAVICLLVCGISFTLRHIERNRIRVPEEELVKMIIIASDSASSKSGEEYLSGDSGDRKKGKGKSGRPSKNHSDKKKRKKQDRKKDEPRDFLSDPI